MDWRRILALQNRTVRDLTGWDAWHVGLRRWMVLPWTGCSSVFLLESLMGLLASSELGRFKLFEVELLTFLDQLLSLVLQAFTFALHRRLEFFEVAQLDLQLLHLCFNQQSYETLDLTLFNCCKMLSLDRCTS